MSPQALISAKNIGLSFNRRNILQSVELNVHRGEIITLIGPNGAGKTSLVRIILGLIKPDQGEVQQAADMRIGYMPQRLTLSPNLPIDVRRFLALADDSHKLDSVADEVGIVHLLKHPMQALSGGETQRVLLARAMLREPDLLVLDEPAQGVDVTGQSELYALIGRIRDRHGCGVLMVSHDLHLVMAATDRVLCLNQHVCCSGTPDAVSQHPAYLELFGAVTPDNLAIYTHHHDHTHDIHGNVIEDHEGCNHG